ncbi:hypothetical protein LXA43DRAFT_997097 [Ganoderma leucocontextum]|nr:hypothetical protein LXA43DRAFT_997097 [Ganoderma leucocontextum]
MSARRPFRAVPTILSGCVGFVAALAPGSSFSPLLTASPLQRGGMSAEVPIERGRAVNVTLVLPSHRHSHPRTCVQLRIPMKTVANVAQSMCCVSASSN